VPWCHATARAARGEGLHIALKSGNFGGTDFFSKAFELLDAPHVATAIDAHARGARHERGCAAPRDRRVGQSLFQRGYVHATAGNISVRLDDGFLITPTDACLGFLDPRRLAKVDAEGASSAAIRRARRSRCTAASTTPTARRTA
jgi:hypothetical protein